MTQEPPVLSNDGEISKEEFLEFIQDRFRRAKPGVLAYYADSFDRSQKSDIYLNWNWSAFLFGPLWFAYRRMYLVAGLAVLFLSLASNNYVDWAASGFKFELNLFKGPLGFLCHIFYGMFGSAFYVWWSRRKIAKGKVGGARAYRVILLLLTMMAASSILKKYYGEPVFRWPEIKHFSITTKEPDLSFEL